MNETLAILKAVTEKAGISISAAKLQDLAIEAEAAGFRVKGRRGEGSAKRKRALEAATKAVNGCKRSELGIQPNEVLTIAIDSFGGTNARILRDTTVQCSLSFAKRDLLIEQITKKDEKALAWAKQAYPGTTVPEVLATLKGHAKERKKATAKK